MISEQTRMALSLSLFGNSMWFGSSTARALYGAALHTGAWAGVNWLVLLVASDAPARGAYGILSGWWASLYLGFVCGIGAEAAVPAFLIYCMYGLVAFAFQWQAFYHGMPDTLDASFASVVLVRALLFTSPILANELVSRTRGWLRIRR